MRRRTKPAKAKVENKRPPARKGPKTDDARLRDLEKRLAKALDGKAEALEEVVGDERKVKQIVLNLLSNAVKFTPEGGRISLKASRTDGAVAIAVTDTGIGIAPEDQAAVFEEFRQVGSDKRRKQEGGLYLHLHTAGWLT